MSLISPNFDVKSIIFSQFWPGAFSQKCWEKTCRESVVAKTEYLVNTFVRENIVSGNDVVTTL